MQDISENNSINIDRAVELIAISSIDPQMNILKHNQQKWISSFELLSQLPKQAKTTSKYLTIFKGLILQINFCQKHRLPIYDIDLLSNPTSDWIISKMPHNLSQHHNSYLCYKTQQQDLLGPLNDIQIVINERKSRFGQDKDVLTIPSGYKIISNPLGNTYLIYSRCTPHLTQVKASCINPINLFSSNHIRNPPSTNHIRIPPSTNHIRNPPSTPIYYLIFASLKVLDSIGSIYSIQVSLFLFREMKGYIIFNFILTLQNAQRIYVTCLNFKEKLSQTLKAKIHFKLDQQIFYDKAFCILSKYSYTDQFALCLQHLYRLSLSKIELPFYRIAQNFVEEMIFPQKKGIQGLSYSYAGSNINFHTGLLYPPTPEMALYCLFKFLPLPALISIFQAVLLQRKIIFVSDSKTVLGYFMEGFLSIIFPFRWQHVLIPIVPLCLKEYVMAPVPLIAGLSSLMLENSIVDNQVVKIDECKIQNDEDLPPLPQKMHKQLIKRLQAYEIYNREDVMTYLQNPQNTYIFKTIQVQNPHFEGDIIRDIFFQFILTLMKNYRKYWRSVKHIQQNQNSHINLHNSRSMNEIFKLTDFLSDLGMSKAGSFGYKFTQSTMFTAFIQKRYQYPNSPDIVFFDECLDKKKTKRNTSFIIPINNAKFIVAKHPLPEHSKNWYSYDTFPSILPPKANHQLNQKFSILEKEQEPISELLQSQTELSNHFYEESTQYDSESIDGKICNLLLNQNKKKYKQFIKKFSNNHQQQLIQKQKLKWFYKIYSQQLQYIDENFELLKNISKQKNQNSIKTIKKFKYFQQNKYKQNGILAIQQCNDYHIIIKEKMIINIKSLLSYHQKENLRNSKQKYSISICIPNITIKILFNQLLQKYSDILFDFIMNKISFGNNTYWTIETIFELKSIIIQ